MKKMKITNKLILFIVVLCLAINIVFNFKTENSNSNSNTNANANANANTNANANSNSNTNKIKTEEGIFESISKYKLKHKSTKSTKNTLKNNSNNTNMKKTLQDNTTNFAKPEQPISYFRGPIKSNQNVIQPGAQTHSLNEVIYNNTKPGALNESVPANGQMLYEGWVQFYVYNTPDKEQLSIGDINERYYKNYAFNDQKRRQINLDLSTMEGSDLKYVPSLYDFWLTVFKDNMNFSAERIVTCFLIIF